jgi:hypothetical protein
MPRHTCLLHPKPSIVWQVKESDCLPHIREAAGGFAGLRLAIIHGETVEYPSLLVACIGSEATTACGMGTEIVTNGLDGA